MGEAQSRMQRTGCQATGFRAVNPPGFRKLLVCFSTWGASQPHNTRSPFTTLRQKTTAKTSRPCRRAWI